MRAKYIKYLNEYMKLNPKTHEEILALRNSKLDDWMKILKNRQPLEKVNNFFSFIRYVINCDEINRGSNHYQGWVTISLSGSSVDGTFHTFKNSKEIQWVKDFIDFYNSKIWNNIINKIFSNLKIYLEEIPTENEIIIGSAI